MVKNNDEAWTLPQCKPITKDVLDRAIGTEEEAASQDYQAREAWFDGQHGTVMLKLTDGRVFGAEPGFISSLQGALPNQLTGLQASDNGMYLVIETLDLHISVDDLVTRIMEESPLAIKRSRARLAGLTTLPAKASLVDGLSAEERALMGEAFSALRRERGRVWTNACRRADERGKRRPGLWTAGIDEIKRLARRFGTKALHWTERP